MEYRTVKEMAELWNVSQRLIQKYCAQGRINGVIKFGGSWRIPENAEKPRDPRSKQEMTSSLLMGLMPLLNLSFTPGHCLEEIEKIAEKQQRDIAYAEYYYFSGQAEKAVQLTERYLTCPDDGLRLSACLIYSFANLPLGEIQRSKYTLGEIERILKSEEGKEATPYQKAIHAFVASAAAILLHLPISKDFQEVKGFLSILPPGLRAFALYVQAHHLYLEKQYERSLGVVEATLAMGAQKYPITAIYLHMIATIDNMSLKRTQQAQHHLLKAWELARPDDLIECFGEHHGLLGGMLESVIKPRWPEDFKRIIAITYRFSSGWRKVHNPATGHDVADNLTTTEFAIAMLAARGWKNQEIAQQLNISSNTVKSYISTILQKLNIKQRKDLVHYVLK